MNAGYKIYRRTKGEQQMPRFKTYVFLPLLYLFFGFTASPSQAANFNVANATELQAALTAAQGNGAADVIRIAQGEYVGNFTYDPILNENFDLTIEGGWNAGFTARTLEPSNTTLNGNSSGRVLGITTSNNTTGNIRVEGLKFINGHQLSNYGGGLMVQTSPPGGITVNKNIFDGNFSEYGGGGLFINMGSSIILSNNIIKNNISGPDTIANLNLPFAGGAYVVCTTNCSVFNNLIYSNNSDDSIDGGGGGKGGGIMVLGSGEINIVNNTITGNNSYTFGGGIYLGGGATASHFYLHNNIIRGNTISPYGGWRGDQDIQNGVCEPEPPAAPLGHSVLIANSDFQYLGDWICSITPTLAENINLDPVFIGGGNYNLGATSPCIDRGSNTVAGFTMPVADLQVNKRIVDGQSGRGVVVDMGAYEYGSTPYLYDLQLPLIIKNQ